MRPPTVARYIDPDHESGGYPASLCRSRILMILTGVPVDILEWAARVYKTNKDAGAALGMSMRGFSRACRRYGIETPYARRQKDRSPALSSD